MIILYLNLVLAVSLLYAAFFGMNDLSNIYILRIAVFALSLFNGVSFLMKKSTLWSSVFLLIAIAFNPFYEISFGTTDWQLMEMMSGILILCSTYLNRKK